MIPRLSSVNQIDLVDPLPHHNPPSLRIFFADNHRGAIMEHLSAAWKQVETWASRTIQTATATAPRCHQRSSMPHGIEGVPAQIRIQAAFQTHIYTHVRCRLCPAAQAIKVNTPFMLATTQALPVRERGVGAQAYRMTAKAEM